VFNIEAVCSLRVSVLLYLAGGFWSSASSHFRSGDGFEGVTAVLARAFME
jgi:hypothetical protein